jgi:hypothetical protein
MVAKVLQKKRNMTNERKNITQPTDWWEAWKAAADAEGVSLSAWIGEQCNAALTKRAVKKLSERAPAHRPTRAGSPHDAS